MDAIENLERQCMKLSQQKEQLICALLRVLARQPDAPEKARALLAGLGYDSARAARMLDLGMPGTHLRTDHDDRGFFDRNVVGG